MAELRLEDGTVLDVATASDGTVTFSIQNWEDVKDAHSVAAEPNAPDEADIPDTEESTL